MSELKILAIEIAKEIIQKDNVKPICFEIETGPKLEFQIDDAIMTFNTLVDLILNEIELIERW